MSHVIPDVSETVASAPPSAQRAFIILNPVAGMARAEDVRAILETCFATAEWGYEVYETTGNEHIETLVREAAARPYSLIVAAGGDGTVSSVASGMIGTDIPLGIIPLGTANVLAQELGIPQTVEAACRLLVEPHTRVKIDGMQVGERTFFLQIGIGLDALMIRDTSRWHKRLFGRVAYIWTALARLFGYQPSRFTLIIDGKRRRPRAAQVLLANGGTFGIPQIRWGPDIQPNDGHIDVCVIYARTLLDYVHVLWHILAHRQRRSRKIRYFPAWHNIVLNADHALPIQADGEILEDLPLHVRIVPDAIQVIVPADSPALNDMPGTPSLADATDRSTKHRPTGKGDKTGMDKHQTSESNAQEKETPDTALPPETGSATRFPHGIDISPEAKSAAEAEKQILLDTLRQIQSPEQARAVVRVMLEAAEGTTEAQVHHEEIDHPDFERVQGAAATLGRDATAEIILEAAKEIAGSSGESREALEVAFQEATNPEQQGVSDPSLSKPLSLLREELLEHMGPLQALDARLFLAINHLPHNRLTNQVMYGITTLMNGGWGWVIGLMVTALLDPRRGRQAFYQIVPPLWFATTLIEFPIKSYFRRRRPFIDVIQAVAVGRKPGTYSFPSGHSASAFAGAWLMSRHYPELRPLWYSIASLVAFSRIYLGVHYPGDVVSGAVAGVLIAEVTRWMMTRPDESGPQ